MDWLQVTLVILVFGIPGCESPLDETGPDTMADTTAQDTGHGDADSVSVGCCGALDPSCDVVCAEVFGAGEIIESLSVRPVVSTFCSEAVGACGVLTERCVNGWCYVPAGSFTGGTSDPAGLFAGRSVRAHTIVVTRPFMMKATEVSNAEWLSVMNATLSPSQLRACGGDCPVADLNLFDVVEFANRLSRRDGLPECYELVGCGPDDPLTGAERECDAVSLGDPGCVGYRLPTESEWELAARAGSSGCWHNGNNSYTYSHCGLEWEPPLDPIAWWCGNSAVDYEGCIDLSHLGNDATDCMGVHPVGTRAPNRLGLFDVVGNVMEMTGTLWDRIDQSTDAPAEVFVDPGHAPVIQREDAIRFRGSGFSFSSIGSCSYVASQGAAIPENEFGFAGFRLVRLAVPSDG